MTLLKDVRLLLIIGLAILCLIALKMCASTYEPMASGDASSTAVVADSEDKAAETANAVATETADATENAEDAAETEEATAVVDADTAEDSTAVAEADVTETTSPGTEATAAEEADTAVASTEAPATEEVTEQVTAQIQSVVPAAEPVVVTIEPIVLRDTAVSGEFMPDLTTDIESVQDGLSQYAEKLDTAKALLDKLKGAEQ